MTRRLDTVCAWCEHDPMQPQHSKVSHGMCEWCRFLGASKLAMQDIEDWHTETVKLLSGSGREK